MKKISDYCKDHNISESELGRRLGVTRHVIHDSKKAGYVVIDNDTGLYLLKVKLFQPKN